MATIKTASATISAISSDGKQIRGHAPPFSVVTYSDSGGNVLGKANAGPDGSWRMIFPTSQAAVAPSGTIACVPPGSADTFVPPV